MDHRLLFRISDDVSFRNPHSFAVEGPEEVKRILGKHLFSSLFSVILRGQVAFDGGPSRLCLSLATHSSALRQLLRLLVDQFRYVVVTKYKNEGCHKFQLKTITNEVKGGSLVLGPVNPDQKWSPRMERFDLCHWSLMDSPFNANQSGER